MTEVSIELVAGVVRPITIPATSVNMSVLPGDSFLCGWALADASGGVPVDAEGSVTSPGAGAAITTTSSVPAGEYTINWTVSLNGAAAAADVDNFGLYSGATLIDTSVNPGAAGNYPQPQIVYTSAATGTFSVKAIGAGTVSVEYSASISVIPSTGIGTQVTIMDGTRIVAPISIAPNDNDSRSYGEGGLRIYTGISLVVNQGTVSGAIMARYLKAS